MSWRTPFDPPGPKQRLGSGAAQRPGLLQELPGPAGGNRPPASGSLGLPRDDPEKHRDAKKGGALNQVAKPKAPFSSGLHFPHRDLSTCHESQSLGLCGNRTGQKPHCPSLQKVISGSVKLLTPGPLPAPWASARRGAGRPIRSPPFWCQSFYSKGEKFKVYTCAEETHSIQGAEVPRVHKLLWP